MDNFNDLDNWVSNDEISGDFEKFKAEIIAIRGEMNSGELSKATIESLNSVCISLSGMGGNTQEAVDMFKDVMKLLDKKAEELNDMATKEDPTISSDEAVALSLRSELVVEGVEDLKKLTDNLLENLGFKETVKDFVGEDIEPNQQEESKKQQEENNSKQEEPAEKKSSEEMIIDEIIRSGEFSEGAKNRLLDIVVEIEKDRNEGKIEGSVSEAVVDKVLSSKKGTFDKYELACVMNYAIEAEKKENAEKNGAEHEKMVESKEQPKRLYYPEEKLKRIYELKDLKNPQLSEEAWAAFDIRREKDGGFSIAIPVEPKYRKEITAGIKTIMEAEKTLAMQKNMMQQQRA